MPVPLPELFWNELREWGARCYSTGRGTGPLWESWILLRRHELEVVALSCDPDQAKDTLEEVAAFVSRLDDLVAVAGVGMGAGEK